MENKISLVEKPCKDCGKVEKMAPSCERCLACRIKRIRKKALEKYYRRKQRAAIKKTQEHNEEIKKIFPVQYIEKGGKYTWHVRQFNPITNRFFIWESDKEFETLLDAQQDYCAATR